LKAEGMRVGIPARIEDLPLISAMFARIAALLPQDIQTT